MPVNVTFPMLLHACGCEEESWDGQEIRQLLRFFIKYESYDAAPQLLDSTL